MRTHPDPGPVILDQAGKGVFATYVDSAPRGRAYARSRDIRARCIPVGVEWVAALVLWQDADGTSRRPPGDLRRAVDTLGADVRVVPWAYVVPGRHEEALDALEAEAEDCGHRTVILDAEAEWYGQSASVAAYASGLRTRGLEGVLTSYGAPWYHGTFPWRAWARACRWGMPQVYDGGARSLGLDYPTRGIDAWARLGWGDRLVPLSRGYAAKGRELARWDGAAIAELASRTPRPAGALGWWSWASLQQSPERWRGVASVEIPGRS